MNYEKNYYNYIDYLKTKNRSYKDGIYYEKHHIRPRSLGGTDSPENIILLTAREHFLAHYLLWKFSTGEDHFKMMYAFKLLSRNFTISSKTYERLSLEFQSRINKKIIRLNDLKVFSSLRKAAIDMTADPAKEKIVEKNISSVLNGHRKTCCGYYFDYYDENRKYEPVNIEKNEKIICLQTLEVFSNQRKAAEKMKIDFKLINDVCVGRKKSTHGYSFSYYDENKKYNKEEMYEIKEFKKALKIKDSESGTVYNSIKNAALVLGVDRNFIRNNIGKRFSYVNEEAVRSSGNAKKIFCKELSRTFDTIEECCRFFKVSRCQIDYNIKSHCLKKIPYRLSYILKDN